MKQLGKIGVIVCFFTYLFCMPTCAVTLDNTQTDKTNISVEEMKEFLIEHDFPSNYLDSLIVPQLEDLYSETVENNAYFYSTSTLPVTVPHDGNIGTDELDLSVTMSYTPYVYQGETYFGEMFMRVDYNWLELPKVRGYDAITVNWDSDLLKYGGDASFTAYDYMLNPWTNQWETYKTWNKPNENVQGGLGIMTYIDSGIWIDTIWAPSTGLAGSVNFSLLPETILSMKIAPESNTTVNAEYTHNGNPLGFGLSFTYDGVGISVSPGSLQYSMSASDVIWYTKV